MLNELFIQGKVHILVEMDETSFFDSLGFGALVAARRKAQAFNGSLGIVCTNERILQALPDHRAGPRLHDHSDSPGTDARRAVARLADVHRYEPSRTLPSPGQTAPVRAGAHRILTA